MTEAQEAQRFRYLFWYVVGLTLFGASLSMYIVVKHPDHIDIILTFWLTSAAMTGINFALGTGINKSKQANSSDNTGTPGTTSVDLQVTQTPTPPAPPETPLPLAPSEET